MFNIRIYNHKLRHLGSLSHVEKKVKVAWEALMSHESPLWRSRKVWVSFLFREAAGIAPESMSHVETPEIAHA